jgi:hypothetical protein
MTTGVTEDVLDHLCTHAAPYGAVQQARWELAARAPDRSIPAWSLTVVMTRPILGRGNDFAKLGGVAYFW